MKRYEFCVIQGNSTLYVYRYKHGRCTPFGPFYVKWKTGRTWRTLSGEKVLRAVRGILANGYQRMVANACRKAKQYRVTFGNGAVTVKYGDLTWARAECNVYYRPRPWAAELAGLATEGTLEISPTDALATLLPHADECPDAARLVKAMLHPVAKPTHEDVFGVPEPERLRLADDDMPF